VKEKGMNGKKFLWISLSLLLLVGGVGFGQQGQQHRNRHGGGEGGGKGGQEGIEADRELFHFLLDHRDQITRKVSPLDNGIESVTESDDPVLVGKLREHVESMHRRLLEGKAIHRRDPLFAAIFDHAKEIELKVEPTEKGLRVVETSSNPDVVKLIQQHAQTVTFFLENGREEVRRDHPPGAAPSGGHLN
jgi:hypothetical protein